MFYATKNFDQFNKIKWAYHTGLSLFAKPAHSILFLSSSSTERRNYHKKRRYNDISKTIPFSTIELIVIKSTDTLSRHCWLGHSKNIISPPLVLFPYELKNEVLYNKGNFLCLGLPQSTPIAEGGGHPTLLKSTSDFIYWTPKTCANARLMSRSKVRGSWGEG